MKGITRRLFIGIIIILSVATAVSASLFLQQNRNKTYRPLNPVDPGSEKYQGAGTVDANNDGVPDFGIVVTVVTPTSARIIFTNAQTNHITHMAIAMDVEPTAWQTFATSIDITGSTGTHTVYVKVKTKNSKISTTLSGTVLLEPAVYVSTTGDDAASGTRAYPMKTIQLAISKTIAQGSHTVMVAQGEYTPGNGLLQDIKGGIIITNHGVRLLGGWTADFSVQNGFSSLKATAMRGIFAEKVSNLFLERFSIYNAKVPADNGGGLYLNAVTNSTLTNINIYECYALNGGGAAVLFSRSNSIHATIYGNKASALGGGMYINDNSDGIDSLYFGRIYGNEAVMGGGIYAGLQGDKIYASVYGNYASDKGGGAYITIMRETFYGDIYQNSAQYGGGVFIPQQNDDGMSMRFARIYENNAFIYGGGVYFNKVVDGEFVFTAVSNKAVKGGGGVFFDNARCNIHGSVDYNIITGVFSSGGGNGGGICISNTIGSIRVYGTVNSNYGDAVTGAGVYLDATNCTFEASNVSYNKSLAAWMNGGGGICVGGASNTIQNTIFSHNNLSDGDNVYVHGDNNTFSNIQSCHAYSNYGSYSIYVGGSNNSFYSCSVMSNSYYGIKIIASNTFFSGIAAYNGNTGIQCGDEQSSVIPNWFTVISNACIYSNGGAGLSVWGGTDPASPNRYGGPIVVMDSYITNNSWVAAYLFIQSNVFFTNNVFACAAANGIAIYEEPWTYYTTGFYGPVLVNNTFATNRMQSLYFAYSTNITDIADLTTGNISSPAVSGNTALSN